jgi:hypothetical protein
MTTIYGHNLLHNACSNNYYELALKTLKNNPEYLNSKDIYGRTPIFWSVWKGAWEITLLLLANKGKIHEQDNNGDTILHIAAEKGRSDEIKKILFYVLKNDNEVRSNARTILDLIEIKNTKNISASEIAKELEDENMVKVLDGIKNLCKERIEEVEKFVFIQDVTMRSGKFNGKKLSNLDVSLVGAKFEFLENSIFLLFKKKNDALLKVELEYKNFAYLILDKEQLKAEITLSNSPTLKIFENGLWKVTKQNIFSDSLSFHCHIFRELDIFKLQKIIEKGNKLTKFQDFCYCFKNETISFNKNDNMIDINPDQQILNKISLLRQKISQLNFGSEKNVDNKLKNNISKNEIVN